MIKLEYLKKLQIAVVLSSIARLSIVQQARLELQIHSRVEILH